MNWLVFHIASGQAFFTGATLIVIAALVSTRTKPIAKRIAALACVIGFIAIAISSAAIPYWYYAIAIVSTLAWIVSPFIKSWRRWAALAVIAVWVVAAVLEAQYHMTPTLRPVNPRSIAVIGDSVTAGMGGGDRSERWPAILARQHDISVQDISHMGETCASALKRAKKHEITSPIVLLEIGGNDLLGSTSSAQFSRDLDELLTHVSAPGRQLIMFELPLPPLHHEYGRVQRSLAGKHKVALVPKRVFLAVLAEEDSTVDTVHLTQAGHDRMAECVWRLVGSAYSEDDPK